VITKEFGKITSAKFGWGGYQDAQFGLSLTIGGPNWGTGDFHGAWGNRPHHADWSLEDQKKQFGDACLFLRDTLTKAKKHSVDELVGVPIEATFDSMRLTSWRILEEVL
jgi:hypothetical protein